MDLNRDLEYARLLVDGKLAAEDNSLPFDSLTWDISEIQASGSYQLKVVVQDVVGLKGETIEVPVDIVVAEKPLTWFQRLTAKFLLAHLHSDRPGSRLHGSHPAHRLENRQEESCHPLRPLASIAGSSDSAG